MIIQGAEPFLFVGNKVGVLLIHGFTGAPKEMRWMGEYMHSQGYTALGIRLPGHATRPEDLLRTTWSDWLASVEDGFDYLKCFCDQIYLVGLSLGGILALTSTARLPVQGVVAMSVPYEPPPDPRVNLLRWLYLVQPKIPKGPGDWYDTAALKDHIEYPDYPTKGFYQLLQLLEVMRNSLSAIHQPALLIQSRNDKSVSPENTQKIYDHLGSQDKNIVWIDKSGHTMTHDLSRQQVFEAAGDFIRRISQIV